MQLYVKLYTVPMICVKRKIFTFTSSPHKIGSRGRKFSTDFKNDLKTSYALFYCRIFARHKVWKIYFGGNDLGSENSEMDDIRPLILSAKTYMFWISSLTAFNLQNLVHRASPAILACSWYSTAVRSKKKSRGYGSFTVLYCVILYSIEIL